MATGTAGTATQPAVPFPLASQIGSRVAFQIAPAALGTGVTVPNGSPKNVQAVGYLSSILLKFTLNLTGTAITASPDAPFNIIDRISVKNSAGNPLIQPVSGYNLYLMNKYSGLPLGYNDVGVGASADPKNWFGVSTGIGGTNPTVTFYLALPFELDRSTGLGSIAATASNREFVVDVSFAAYSTAYTAGVTAATLQVDATSVYWSVPAQYSPQGAPQQQAPFGPGTVGLYQVESGPVSSGDNLFKSNNVGNIIRNHILVLRTSAGARTETDWTNVLELMLDNAPRFHFSNDQWRQAISQWFGYTAAIDNAGGQDSGVYVIPYFLLAGGQAGDPKSNSQWLQTLDATLLQFHAFSFGANASRLEVITHAVSAPNPAFVYYK